jgi:hypothetical protein
MTKFNWFKSLLILIVICSPLCVLAQPDPGGDVDLPIDGGLSLLLAAGIGYGAKKAYDAKKKQENAEK